MNHVLILGANSGLATALARLLCGEVDHLSLVGRDSERLASLQSDLEVRGNAKIRTLVCDLALDTAEFKVRTWLDQMQTPIDTVYLSHGILGDQAAMDQDPKLARALMVVNLVSFVELGLSLATRMARLGRGHIIVFSSVAGERGKQSNCVYSASMAGRTVFADGLRHRFKKQGVQVTTMKLGQFDSPMTAHIQQGPLWVSSDTMAKYVLKVTRRRSDSRYIPAFWWTIMFVIRSIPERIFLRTGL